MTSLGTTNKEQVKALRDDNEFSVVNCAVFPRNWACFKPVPRGKVSSCGLRFFGLLFYTHAAIVGLVPKLVIFTSYITLRAVILYII